MIAFIARRLLLSLLVIFFTSWIVFLLIHLTPGDPAIVALGPNATQEEIHALRAELWLDKPFIVQYGHRAKNFIKGDFGNSIIFHEKVIDMLAKRFPITLQIGVIGLILSDFMGISAGTICAVRRGKFVDTVITVFANMGVSIPVFWLGILGIYLFGLKLGWLPIQGYTSPFDNFSLSIRQLIMPIVCVAVVPISSIARQTRSAVLEVTRQDYVNTAWSKGLKERDIIIKHCLKNALIPVITLMGMQLTALVSSVVFVENVFNIPGIGRLMVQAAYQRDFIIIQAIVMVTAVLVTLVNLGVDICYGWLDPRIRYG